MTISNILLLPADKEKHFSGQKTPEPQQRMIFFYFVLSFFHFHSLMHLLVPPLQLQLCIHLNVALSEVRKSSVCVDKYVGCLLDDVVL